MASGFQESANGPSRSYSTCGNASGDSGGFECNICFDLAQDPIVTLCGHLFCWPCLYKWLHHHSQSQECPVCKALVQEEKLVPLYGRGKTASDPRSRPVPGVEIPHRPSGQRPQTAPTPPPPPPPPPGSEAGFFPNLGFGLLGGFAPMATARFGNMTMSAGFGGLFPSILNFQLNGFGDAGVYGAAQGYPYGYNNQFHGVQGYQRTTSQGQDSILKTLLLCIGIFVLLTLVWS